MRRIAGSLLLALVTVGAALPAGATSFDTNLVVNGDAEADAPSASGYEIVPAITGWSRTGELTLVAWATGGGFPVNTDAGPAVRGASFFAGGPGSASSEMSQVLDISDLATAIDAGSVGFRLAGYLGGFSSQGDNATLEIAFRDGGLATIGTAALGPVTPADRGSITGLLRRAQDGAVPAGTRSVRIRLLCTRLEGSYNDGYADSLAFALTSSTVGVGWLTPPAAGLAFAPISPNPVRDAARFEFRLPRASEVRLDVFGLDGRRVATVSQGPLEAGAHAVTWRRGEFRPGVYFARLQAGTVVLRRPFVVLD